MKTLEKFWDLAKGKLGMFLAAVAIIVILFIIAMIAERYAEKKNPGQKITATRKVTLIGMFAALAAVLMYIEFPLWFAPPEIYKLDFSEVPVLVCSFILGPVSGVVCEFVKILIKLIIKPTSTAFVGEFANFVVGCAFVVPASVIYRLKKSRKNAVVGMCVGTVFLTIVGSLINALFLIPVFSVFYGMPLEVILAMGTKLNGSVTDIFTFAALIVAPFNLLKGILVSVITFFIYKPIRAIL